MIFSSHRQKNFEQITLTIALIAVCGFFSVGFAAETEFEDNRETRYFYEPPTVEEMGEYLFPRRTRGIVLPKQVAAEQKNTHPTEKSVGLPVLFHFGKTTLVDSSKPFLDKIGELLQLPEYENETLIVEGHTDAVGGDTTNQRLSELRALAVKEYLVQRYGIDPLRLFPEGKGESRLFDRANPLADKNRRVEFLRY